MTEDTKQKINAVRIRLQTTESDLGAKKSGSWFVGETTIGLAETIEESTDKMIQSNEKLSESNDRHSKSMFWLTWVLVAVGILQIAILLIQILVKK